MSRGNPLTAHESSVRRFCKLVIDIEIGELNLKIVYKKYEIFGTSMHRLTELFQRLCVGTLYEYIMRLIRKISKFHWHFHETRPLRFCWLSLEQI